jgi:hypothetical protein
MSRHIVRPFHLVHPAGMRRRESPERGDKVGAHIGVGILLNHERCRGVLQVDKDGAIPRFDSVEEARHVACDFKKTFAGCLHRQDGGRDRFNTRNADGGKLAQSTSPLSTILSEIPQPLFAITLYPSTPIEDLFLRSRDRFDKAVPDVIDERHHAIDIGVAR